MSSGEVLRYRSEVLIFEVLKLWGALVLLEGCSARSKYEQPIPETL